MVEQRPKDLPVTAAFLLSLNFASSISMDLRSQNQSCQKIPMEG